MRPRKSPSKVIVRYVSGRQETHLTASRSEANKLKAALEKLDTVSSVEVSERGGR